MTSDSYCGVNARCKPAEQADAPINTVAQAKSASGSNCVWWQAGSMHHSER